MRALTLFEATEKVLGRIVREFYSHLGNWPAEQLRELKTVISRLACDFCIQVSDVDYHAECAAKK